MISREEYWILDVVRDIDWLSMMELASDDPGGSLNREPHGMTFDQLVETVHVLFTQGYLIAIRFFRIPVPGNQFGELEEDNWVGGSEDFIPNEDDIRHALRGEEFYQFRLTAQGAAVWEANANPDWSKYATWEGSFDSEEQVRTEEFCSANKQLIEQLVGLLPNWIGDLKIDYEFETLISWQATYWKTLPTGYRVKVILPNEDSAAAYYARQQEDPAYYNWQDDYFSLLREWYTNPFKET